MPIQKRVGFARAAYQKDPGSSWENHPRHVQVGKGVHVSKRFSMEIKDGVEGIIGSHLQGNWFTEELGGTFAPGQTFSLKVKEVLAHQRSKYQDILVFESESYGKVLALDKIIQCTEKDEFSYQEMIAHLALFSHPCPKSVLVVGGGDGGVLREVGKHPMVEEIHLCEVDEEVIELSKRYLKHMAVGFDNPKVKVYVQDATKFLPGVQDKYDVIITDCSDPVGPAVCLYEEHFFHQIEKALKPGGILSMQGMCVWLSDDMSDMRKVISLFRNIFPVVKYAIASVPSYTTGTIGFLLASKSKSTVFECPLRLLSEEDADKLNLHYYDSQVHKAAFTLPRFIKQEAMCCSFCQRHLDMLAGYYAWVTDSIAAPLTAFADTRNDDEE